MKLNFGSGLSEDACIAEDLELQSTSDKIVSSCASPSGPITFSSHLVWCFGKFHTLKLPDKLFP